MTDNPPGAPTVTAPAPIAGRRQEFIAGARDTVPLLVGAAPFGTIFGALAITAGLTPGATLGMSLFVFAGSAQFIAAGLIAQNVALLLIVITTFIVNLRHALYAASLGPHMKHLSQKWLLPLGFWLTDETYAVVIRRYSQDSTSPYRHWYHLGSAVAMYSNWQAWTLLGILAGTRIENAADLGLDFAMVVTFIGMTVLFIENRALLISAAVAGVVALIAYGLPHQLGLMVAALAGIGAGVLAENHLPKVKRDDDIPQTKEIPEEVRS